MIEHVARSGERAATKDALAAAFAEVGAQHRLSPHVYSERCEIAGIMARGRHPVYQRHRGGGGSAGPAERARGLPPRRHPGRFSPTAAWSTQLRTGSAPQHDSPLGQSADVLHGSLGASRTERH